MFSLTETGAVKNKYKLLTRMMKLTEQSDYEEVKLRKDDEWSPKAVFSCCVTGRCVVS